MTEHSIVIVGAGPTGLMLAGELALGGADAIVIERRTDQFVDKARAGGLHARTLEVLDQRGIVSRFVDAGQRYPSVGFAYIQLDVSDLPTRHNYLLGLPQSRFEPLLAEWVAEMGVPIVRGRDVIGFEQDEQGVTVEISDGTSLRAQYLVGCDGGRSFVRRHAGIEFPGFDPSISFVMADADTTEPPVLGIRPEGGAIGPLDPQSPDGPHAFVVREPRVGHTGEPTLDDLRAALVAGYGTDFGVHSPTRISRFTDMSRQAATYRSGRVLLAGDAAHVHAPFGGQGLNTGVQDAVNLGWKLAQVVSGMSSPELLDSYHRERHPAGAAVLHTTMAQAALIGADARRQALQATMRELLAFDEPRRHLAERITALDVRYGSDAEPGLVGCRMPDVDLTTTAGPTRASALLHDARGVLLELSPRDPFDVSSWGDRVRHLQARSDAQWNLPGIGSVTAPPAVLIRPDGHIGWVGDVGDPSLPHALSAWFGSHPRSPPAAARR